MWCILQRQLRRDNAPIGRLPHWMRGLVFSSPKLVKACPDRRKSARYRAAA